MAAVTELRAFLYSLDDEAGWLTSTFTELEPLMAAAQAAVKDGDRAALIHVGFWQPSISDVAAIAALGHGSLIVSDPAAGALCDHLTVGAAAIGCVRGVVFRRVLGGLPQPWSPEAPASMVDVAASSTHRLRDLAVAAAVTPTTGNWLSELAASDADLFEHARAAGVVDDESYLRLEAALPRRSRLDLGLARFALVSGVEPEVETILDNLWAGPPWFMDLGVAVLGLTVRQANVFRTNNIQRVADIAALGTAGLFKLPSLGQGSIYTLQKLLLAALEGAKGLPIERVDLTPVVPEDDGARQGADSLRACFKSAAGLLGDAERNVWAGRLGFECSPMTLQELADGMGLSRERVRQLENQIYRKVQHHPFWEELAVRLDAALQSRSSALGLTDLPAVVAWFAEAPQLANALIGVLRRLLPDRFGVFQIGQEWVISHLLPEEWLEVCESARTLLESGAKDRIEEGLARWQVDQLLSGRGEELRAALWAEATANALWSARPGEARRLVALDRGATSVVLAVLESSEVPLHYADIHRPDSK